MKIFILFGILGLCSYSQATPTRLQTGESSLRSEFESLQNDHLLPSQILERLKAESDPEKRRSIIAQGELALKTFQEHYDAYSNDKLTTFADTYRPRLECLAEYTKGKKKIQSLYSDSAKQYQEYKDHLSDFGTNLDFRRIGGFKRYFQKFRDLSFMTAKKLGFDLDKDPNLIGTAFKSLPQLLGLLKSVFFNQNSAPGMTPIQDRFSNLEQKLAKRVGVKVDWSGQENLPAMKLDGKNLYIYAYQHVNPFLDNIALGHFPAKGVGMIGAVERVLPGLLAKQILGSDHYVPVDQVDPNDVDNTPGLDKLEHIVKSGKLAGFFLSPEGNTAAGLDDMRPALPAFGNDLLTQVWARDLEIHIVPLSFPDDFQLFTDFNIRGWVKSGPVRGVISSTLDSALLKEWVQVTGDNHSVGRLVRAVWMENMKTNAEQLLSMTPADKLEAAVQEYTFPSAELWDSNHCSAR